MSKSFGSVRHGNPNHLADGLPDRASSSFLTMHAIAPVVFLLIAVLAVMLAVLWF
jgi:hypothetical protein